MLPVHIRSQIKEKLIRDAVKDLQRWLFPNVNEKNIFYDTTYSYFFERILEKKKGMNNEIDFVIEELLFELKFVPKKT